MRKIALLLCGLLAACGRTPEGQRADDFNHCVKMTQKPQECADAIAHMYERGANHGR